MHFEDMLISDLPEEYQKLARELGFSQDDKAVDFEEKYDLIYNVVKPMTNNS